LAEWRLFIDASEENLKGVLLHSGNEKPSVPVFHSTVMKESYESMKLILKILKYNEFKWAFCGNLKVIGLVLGMQGGITKYMCFLC